VGERRGAYRIFVEKRQGRRPLGRSGRRWEDHIKVDLREVGWGYGLDRSGLGERQMTGCCECGNEPSGSIKCEEFLD
jgi:hypothetical protein